MFVSICRSRLPSVTCLLVLLYMLNPASSTVVQMWGFNFFLHKKRIFLQAGGVYLPLLVWNWKVTLGSQSLWSWANFRRSTFYPDLQDAQRGIGHSSEQSEQQLKTSCCTYVSLRGHISEAACARSVGGGAERGFIWCHTNTHTHNSLSLNWSGRHKGVWITWLTATNKLSVNRHVQNHTAPAFGARAHQRDNNWKRARFREHDTKTKRGTKSRFALLVCRSR